MQTTVTPPTPTRESPLDYSRVAQELQIRKPQVEIAVELLDAGNTIPYVFRYHQDETGGLDQSALRHIQKRAQQLKQLADRRQSILKSIDARGQLTPELRKALHHAETNKRLDDLYLPFKPRKRTLATEAREKGLEPLAEAIWHQDPAVGNLEELLPTLVSPEKNLHRTEDVVSALTHLLAERVSEVVQVRAQIRFFLWDHVKLHCTKNPKLKDNQGNEFKELFNSHDPIRTVPPHRLLTMFRGERAKVLQVELTFPHGKASEIAWDKLGMQEHRYAGYLKDVCEDALNRLLLPTLEREIRKELREIAEEHAIEVIARNFSSFLMTPPVRDVRVLGIDPAFRQGCKIVALDENGTLLDRALIYPHHPQKRVDYAKRKIEQFIRQYQLNVIAIGSGPAVRETEELISQIIEDLESRNWQGEPPQPEPEPVPEEKAEDGQKEETEGAKTEESASETTETANADGEKTEEGSSASEEVKAEGATEETPATEEGTTEEPSSEGEPDAPQATSEQEKSEASTEESAPEASSSDEESKPEENAGEGATEEAPTEVSSSTGEEKSTEEVSSDASASEDSDANKEEKAPESAESGSDKPKKPKEKRSKKKRKPPEEEKIELLELPAASSDLAYLVISSAGATAYAKEVGSEELPDCDTGTRVAVSIGRRVQDPLSELVKVDPMSIGSGPQHQDLNEKQIRETLETVVSSCVNAVGANLSTASASMLKRVSGLNQLVAQDIVRYRQEKGPFKTREQLLEVPSIKPDRFVQCAGFTRVVDGDEPLDQTRIHPQYYDRVRELLEELGTDSTALNDPDRHRELCKALRNVRIPELMERWELGEASCYAILDELSDPLSDPRAHFPPPILRRHVTRAEELEPGMELQGTILNVVDFGAFVDIGLKESGLVHISQLANRFVRDPYELVAVGDVVTVWVMGVDPGRNRVSLTMVAPQTERERPRRGRESHDSQRGEQDAPRQHQERRPETDSRPPRDRGDRGRQRGDRREQSTGALPRRGERRGFDSRKPRSPRDPVETVQTEQTEATAPRKDKPAAKRPQKKPAAKPKLSKSALQGESPLGTFAELAVFWAEKEKPEDVARRLEAAGEEPEKNETSEQAPQEGPEKPVQAPPPAQEGEDSTGSEADAKSEDSEDKTEEKKAEQTVELAQDGSSE